MLAYVLSFIIRLALSRSREFLADAGSVELTKNPDAMISALRKIEGRGELPGATSAVMEMCIDNPRQGFGELFDTHPSVDNRVAALVKFAGGHDPGPLALPPQASIRPRHPAPRMRSPAQRLAQRVAHGAQPKLPMTSRRSLGVRLPKRATPPPNRQQMRHRDRGARTRAASRATVAKRRVPINHIALKILSVQGFWGCRRYREASKQTCPCVKLR